MRTLATILLAAGLCACAAASTNESASVLYACDDGTTLSVRFAGEAAYVTTGTGPELVLPQQMSGSGFRYATPQHELRGKGDEATWAVGRRVPVNCRVRQ